MDTGRVVPWATGLLYMGTTIPYQHAARRAMKRAGRGEQSRQISPNPALCGAAPLARRLWRGVAPAAWRLWRSAHRALPMALRGAFCAAPKTVKIMCFLCQNKTQRCYKPENPISILVKNF